MMFEVRWIVAVFDVVCIIVVVGCHTLASPNTGSGQPILNNGNSKNNNQHNDKMESTINTMGTARNKSCLCSLDCLSMACCIGWTLSHVAPLWHLLGLEAELAEGVDNV